LVFNELHDKSVDGVISSCFVPISEIILVVPKTKLLVISTSPSIVPPVSSNLLSNADCNPAVCVMDKPLSCMVSCFPCYASSTSPIIGRVIVSTVIEPLTSRSPIILKGKMNAFAFA